MTPHFIFNINSSTCNLEIVQILVLVTDLEFLFVILSIAQDLIPFQDLGFAMVWALSSRVTFFIHCIRESIFAHRNRNLQLLNFQWLNLFITIWKGFVWWSGLWWGVWTLIRECFSVWFVCWFWVWKKSYFVWLEKKKGVLLEKEMKNWCPKIKWSPL